MKIITTFYPERINRSIEQLITPELILFYHTLLWLPPPATTWWFAGWFSCMVCQALELGRKLSSSKGNPRGPTMATRLLLGYYYSTRRRPSKTGKMQQIERIKCAAPVLPLGRFLVGRLFEWWSLTPSGFLWAVFLV